MTFNASDRKAIRRAEKSSALAERNRIAYIRQIMSEPFGRAWMHDLLAAAGMFQSQFAPNNMYATAYNLGKADLAKPIWADVFSHCPDQYVLMMQEQALKEAADARRADNDRDTDRTPDTTGTEQDSGRDDSGPIDGDDNYDGPGEPGTIRYFNQDGTVYWPTR